MNLNSIPERLKGAKGYAVGGHASNPHAVERSAHDVALEIEICGMRRKGMRRARSRKASLAVARRSAVQRGSKMLRCEECGRESDWEDVFAHDVGAG